MKSGKYGLVMAAMVMLAQSWLLRADFFGPIDVAVKAEGLSIEHSASILKDQAMLQVKNLNDFDVQCEVKFMNGPELIIRRIGFVTAAKEILFHAPLRRTVVKLAIDLECVEVGD